MAGNVVSAAVISGELIIGLDDGSVIRAGYVQGPQGLKGDRGPMGATGSRGIDGNTIHTVKGPPPADLGTEGDYAINNRDWFIFGPKASGLWGAGQPMLPKNQKVLESGRGGTTATGGGGSGGSGGSSGPIYTNTVQLTAPTRTLLATTTGYRVLPDPGSGKQNQEDANRWAFGEVFDSIDQAIPVHTGELPPPTMPGFIDVYDGRLWFKTLNNENRLYIYDDGEWLPCTDIRPVSIGDDPPASAQEGDLWWNSDDDELTLYVYYDGNWVPAAPPVSLDGVNSVISSALEVQAEILARLDTGEAIQATLQDTVTDALDVQNTLQNRVEALEGTVIDGKWMLDNRSVAREGYFLGLAGVAAVQDWTLVTRLQMNPVDSTGKSFTFAEVSIDDVVRVGGVGGNAAFKMTSTFTPAGDVYEADVQLLSHSGVMAETLVYDFEFLPSFDPSTYATIEYVNDQDDLDVKKTGDTMTGHLKVTQPGAATSNYLFSVEAPHLESGKQVAFRVTGDGKVKAGYDTANPFMATAANDVLTKNYADEKLIYNSGTQTLDSSRWRLQQPDENNVNRNYIEIENQNMKLFHVQDPTDGTDAWAANKGYVDSEVATAVDGLATEEYVDTEVAKVAGQTQTYWYYASHQTAENLQPGEFFVSDINEHLYLHTTSANGVDLGVGSSERVFNIITLFSVHATSGNSMYCAKSDRINFGSGSNNYMRVAQDTVFFRQQLNQNTKYVLNIPGFTP